MAILRAPVAAGGTSRAAISSWGPGASVVAAGALTASSLALNDADNAVAAVFVVPKDGTINQIGINLSAKTGTSSAVKYNVGLTTLSVNPTQTAYGGSSPAQPTLTSLVTGFQWLTLVTPATVAAGDVVCAQIWPEGSTAPSASFTVTIRTRLAGIGSNLPYEQEFAAAWSINALMPLIAVRYSDGTLIGGLYPLTVAAPNTAVFTNATTPDEIGALFQVPFGCTCIGVRFYCKVAAVAATATVKLYSAANALLGSDVLGASAQAVVTNYNTVEAYWDPVALTALTDYRVTMLATSADNRQLAEWTVPDVDSKNGFPNGARWQRTERAAAGAWTDTNLVIPLWALLLSEVTS